MITNIYDQLRRDEGVKHTLYTDTTGHPTIGVGHNLLVPISDTAVTQILRDDVAHAQREACDVLGLGSWEDLSRVRQGVLTNMAFNLGAEGLRGFKKFLSAVRQGRWGEAAREMLDSTWAVQVGDRARRLATQMETGEWQ